MQTVLFMVEMLIVISAALVVFVKLFRRYLRYRGKMVVTCPETKRPVGISVDAGYAAMTEVMTTRQFSLTSCTRWPERENCGQECLAQILDSPENCLVKRIISDWYQGKTCVYCKKRFDIIHWHDHKPALQNPLNRSIEWDQIAIENLYETLATHKPICWNCYVAETFRRTHPELITDRPWKRGHLV